MGSSSYGDGGPRPDNLSWFVWVEIYGGGGRGFWVIQRFVGSNFSLKLHVGESLQSANMLLLAMGRAGRATIVTLGEFWGSLVCISKFKGVFHFGLWCSVLCPCHDLLSPRAKNKYKDFVEVIVVWRSHVLANSVLVGSKPSTELQLGSHLPLVRAVLRLLVSLPFLASSYLFQVEWNIVVCPFGHWFSVICSWLAQSSSPKHL